MKPPSRLAITAIALLSAAACAPKPETSYVDVANPFLVSTVEQFRLSARDAMLRKDISAMANQLFLLKRSLPVAWAAVVDSSGTVLMHTDPALIAAVLSDRMSAESLAYADVHHPLVRRLWSADHRPVLDFTLPVKRDEPGPDDVGGYVRIGFYAGSRMLNWDVPPSE